MTVSCVMVFRSDPMRWILIAALTVSGAVLAPPAEAGGYYRGGVFVGGYRPFYRPYYGHRAFVGPRFYGPRHFYGWRGGYHWYGHGGYSRGAYAAGGLLLGVALGNALAVDRGPVVVERRTVYTQPAGRVEAASLSRPISEPLPALGYRVARDGTCLLLEDGGDGRTYATPQPPEDCR